MSTCTWLTLAILDSSNAVFIRKQISNINLYLGGSSGNRGFRGPVCSDLLFFEPDILQLVIFFL